MAGWQWILTPGHSPGHVSLWRASDRTLIAGAAFVTVKPESVYTTAMQTAEARASPVYFKIEWSGRNIRSYTGGPEAESFLTGMAPMHDANMNDALEILADFIQIVLRSILPTRL